MANASWNGEQILQILWKSHKGYAPVGRLYYSTFWPNISKIFSFKGSIPLSLHRWGWNLARLLRAKFHPHRCNVSPLRGENPQNRPQSKLNNRRFALRAMLPVNYCKYTTVITIVITVNMLYSIDYSNYYSNYCNSNYYSNYCSIFYSNFYRTFCSLHHTIEFSLVHSAVYFIVITIVITREYTVVYTVVNVKILEYKIYSFFF